jgi:hypothetical protein
VRWVFCRRDDNLVIYGSAHPKRRVFGLFVVLIIFVIILNTQFPPLLNNPSPLAVGRALALLAATMACLFVARALLTRWELRLDCGRHTLTFHRHLPWGRLREETLHAEDVRYAVLVHKRRGRSYKSLYLILSDNRTRPVDEGEEDSQMDRLAADMDAALGGRLLQLDTGLEGPRFVRVAQSKETLVYLDLRNRERRQNVPGFLLMAAAMAAIGVGPLVVMLFDCPPEKVVETLIRNVLASVFALFWLAGAWMLAFAGFRCAIIMLRYLRLVELVIHRGAAGVTLRYLSWRKQSWEETWAAADLADVVAEGKTAPRGKRGRPGFKCTRIWLRRHDGRMLLLDRAEVWWNDSWAVPRSDQSLAACADALGEELGAPVKRVMLGRFGRWFG